MDRKSTRLAVWLPEPLTVATWMLRSLTMRWVAGWTPAARTARSLVAMGSPSGDCQNCQNCQDCQNSGSETRRVVANPKGIITSGAEGVLHGGPDVRRALHDA